MSQAVQVVVPIYNEGDGVLSLYEQLIASDCPFDSLKFVYDIDDDTSLPYLAELSARDSRATAEKNLFGPGVLKALKWSFSRSEDGPLFVVMGDCSDHLCIMKDMLELWKGGSCIVSPSRYMPGGRQYGGGAIKGFLSRAAGLSLYVFGFPTRDPTNNFKLYDASWLRSVEIESRGGFEIALELCYKAYSEGREIAELPTIWRDRKSGESKFRLFAWLPQYLRWYFKILFQLGRKRVGG